MNVKPCALSAARTNRHKPSVMIGAEARRSAVRRVRVLLEFGWDMLRMTFAMLRFAKPSGKDADTGVEYGQPARFSSPNSSQHELLKTRCKLVNAAKVVILHNDPTSGYLDAERIT